MIKKLRSDRKVRRITRSLARLYIDLTWVDSPLFMREIIDEPSSSISHITEKLSSTDRESRLWHKWGFTGDAPILSNFLKDFLPHKTEEQFAQNVHDLACKMLKKGYLEHTPQSYIGSRYEGEMNDVGKISITQRNSNMVTGNHLSLSQKAYSLPSNDSLQFISLLLSNAMPLTLVLLAVLQILEIARNLGIVDWVRTFIR